MQILNEYIYEYVVRDVIWKPYSWIGIILGLVILIGGIWLFIEIDAPEVYGIFIGILLVICFFIFFTKKEAKEVTRYEVILTEDVSYRDFTNKYKVIEERGDILVVEEKINESN